MVAAFALLLSSAYKVSIFSVINPVPPYFLHLKFFLRKGYLTVKNMKKKSSIRFWATAVSVLKYVHIQDIFSHKLLKLMTLFTKCAKHKVKSYTYCLSQFLREKRQKKRKKKRNQECKQKQSLLFKKQSVLFNVSNIFDLLTSRTEKIVWWSPVFKPLFCIFSYNKQLTET